MSRSEPLAKQATGLTWRETLRVYTQWRMLSMVLLGFSAGLPFVLVGTTMGAWLKTVGIAKSTIGMFAWVSLLYTIKWAWSPIVDRMPLPFLTRWLGRRRSWMLLAQVGIVFGLFNLSLHDPAVAVLPIALWALFIAFSSATQDIALDAWRIESAGSEGQAAMASAYQVGYRMAILVNTSVALVLAQDIGFKPVYALMALFGGVGIVTTLFSKEPQATARKDSLLSEERVVGWLAARPDLPKPLREVGAWFIGAVVCPLLDFFARFGVPLAMLALIFMGCYRLTDYTMGVMTNPFYLEQGYTLKEIGAVLKSTGVTAAIVGVILAGLIITKIGTLRALILGSAMVMISNLGFSTLATLTEPNLLALSLVNGFDNLALAMHGTALITFMSNLTSSRYTATQYALFSSFYALPGKVLEGFSGFIAEALGWQMFFIYTASLSIPALLLLYWVNKHGVIKTPTSAPAPA